MSQPREVFELTQAQQSYLEQQLGAVSRSFALVIPTLEVPLRYYLTVAYLLCRVVDNIEDCGQPYTWQEKRFSEFLQLLHDPRHVTEALSYWEGEPWPALTDLERQLMGVSNGLALWEIYAQMPQAVREIVEHWTRAMAQGMSQLGDPKQRPFFIKRQDIDVIATPTDYDDYCYYVAGTVGHLATDLVVRQYQLTEDVAQALRPYAESCGRSLQKTNIIKDFVEDLTRKICYLPDAWLVSVDYSPLDLQGASSEWKAMVLTNVLEELRSATEYMLALPYSASGYRRASLLCLLPSYQTMLLAAQRQTNLFTPYHNIKISRLTMAQCLADSQVLLHDNKSIVRYGKRLENEILSQFNL